MCPQSVLQMGAVIRNGLRVINTKLSDRALLGPKTVRLALTNVCNANCVFCPYFSEFSMRDPVDGRFARLPQSARERYGLDASAWWCDLSFLQELARDLRQMHVEEVILSGKGEPITHPNIEQICRMFGAAHKTYLLTNGITLLTKRIAMLMSGDLMIRLSLHAASKATWAAIHPQTEASQFDRIIEGVRHIQQTYGDRVEIHNVICRQNHHECLTMLELARQLGVRVVRFLPFSAQELREPERFNLTPSEKQDVARQLVEVARLAPSYGITTNAAYYGTMLAGSESSRARGAGARTHDVGGLYRQIACTIGYVMVHIDPDSSVRPCCRCDYLGNFSGRSFKEYWNGADYRAFRRAGERITASGFVDGCACDECQDFVPNIRVHNILHPQRRLYG